METVDVGEEMANLFDPTTNLYTQTIFLCLILLGFGVVCGIFYELIRRRRNARRVKPQSKKHFYSTSLHSTPLHSTPLHSNKTNDAVYLNSFIFLGLTDREETKEHIEGMQELFQKSFGKVFDVLKALKRRHLKQVYLFDLNEQNRSTRLFRRRRKIHATTSWMEGLQNIGNPLKLKRTFVKRNDKIITEVNIKCHCKIKPFLTIRKRDSIISKLS